MWPEMRPPGAMATSSCRRRSVTDPLSLPFTEARRQLSARSYVGASLRAIGQHNAKLNAFIHVAGEGAGAPLSVPIAIKDNIVTRDMPTTCGSQILAKFVSPFEATAV